jgi:hypothetical protein
MTTNPSQHTDPPGQAPGSSVPPPGQAPTQTPSQAGGDSQQQHSLSQDDVQRVIADLRKENAAHRKKAKEQEEQAQAAEQERLRQAGEYKQLAEQHEKRVKELEPVQESYTRLAEQINAQIAAEVKDWPTEVKSLVPDTNVPVESRLEQVAKLRPLIAQLTQQARGQAPGNRPNPPAQGQPSREDMVEANMNVMRRDPRYQRGRIF